MQIRTKLTVQFIIVVTLIILSCFGIIYYSASTYRSSEFYLRLETKAITHAEMLLSVPHIDSTLLRAFDRSQKDKLRRENISVYNARNQKIYSSNDSISFQVTDAQIVDIRKRGRKELTENPFEILGLRYVSKGQQYVVIAGAIDKYGLSKLTNLRVTMLFLFFLMISIVAFTGWQYAGRVLLPLSSIIDQVDKINVERLDARLQRGKNNDEIGRLIQTFNILLERVENSVKLQKLFVNGASHELKNPLTTITSQLQVVLLNERSAEEYKTIISSILEDIRKLNRTTLDLIEYARLNYEDEIQFAEVRIDDVIWECRDFFVKNNNTCKVQLNFDRMPDDEKRLIVRGNDALLKVAFINLIDNACKFSENKTCVITLSVFDKRIHVSFSDNGIGLSEEEQQLIFEPFYRANNTAEVKGHGVGLALTKKIAQVHRAFIDVTSAKGEGTTFRLYFEN